MFDYPKDPYTGVIFASADAVPLEFWTWDNFRPHELACKGTGKVLIDPHSMDCLQRLRNILGQPIHLNSAFRSKSHNRAVGGAKNSYHLTGRAYDVRMRDHTPRSFERAARIAGFTGFGFYPPKNGGYNFTHIDTGPAREWGQRW